MTGSIGHLRADIIAFILLFLLKVEKTIGKEQAEIKARHEANQSETIDA